MIWWSDSVKSTFVSAHHKNHSKPFQICLGGSQKNFELNRTLRTKQRAGFCVLMNLPSRICVLKCPLKKLSRHQKSQSLGYTLLENSFQTSIGPLGSPENDLKLGHFTPF